MHGAERAVAAVKGHKRFGFNYDPSHLGYQGVDYVKFIRTFGKQIHHAHMKDVWWGHGDGTVGVFGGQPGFLRFDPKTQLSEIYSPPAPGYGGRGGDIDRNGVFWLDLDQEVAWSKAGGNLVMHSSDLATFSRTLNFNGSRLQRLDLRVDLPPFLAAAFLTEALSA